MDERPSDGREHPLGPEDSLIHNVYDRLLNRWIRTHRARVRVGYGLVTFILVFSIALGVATVWLDINSDRLRAFGYFGIFFLNLISTSTFFIPVPGFTAAGQALIVSEAPRLGAWQVGLIGGLGMGLGEITAYVAGSLGREVAQGRQIGGPAWFQRPALKAGRWVQWLMERYGVITLFVLSVLPNPVFEVAGLTAGAVRMNFWRFLLPVLAGKIARGLVLAYVGEFSIHLLGL